MKQTIILVVENTAWHRSVYDPLWITLISMAVTYVIIWLVFANRNKDTNEQGD